MKSSWTQLRILTLLIVGIALLVSACQKKCQQNTQVFKKLKDTQWRLVYSNDPNIGVKKLNKFNFLIYSFKINFTGEVFKVVNNDQFDTPILTFKWNPDPNTREINIEYTKAGSVDENGEVQAGESAGSTTYAYDLSTTLNLNDQKKGYSLEFVPMTGVVDPDDTCEF